MTAKTKAFIAIGLFLFAAFFLLRTEGVKTVQDPAAMEDPALIVPPVLDQNTFFTQSSPVPAAPESVHVFEDVTDDIQQISDEEAALWGPASD